MTEINLSAGTPPSPPDPRDFAPQAVSPEVVATLPRQFVVSAWAPIQSQGREGTCSGQAGKGWADHHEVRLGFGRLRSARDLYEGARALTPISGEGAYLRDICKRLAKTGACEERFWPYAAGVKGAPQAGADESRATCRALEYFRIPSEDIVEIKAAIAQYGPLLIRIEVCDGFRRSRSGEVIKRTGAQGGGHAVIAIGWNDDTQTLRIRNSWATTWGEQGYGNLSYDYGVTEAWALTPAVIERVPTPAPAPVPPPVPAPPPPPPPAPWWMFWAGWFR